MSGKTNTRNSSVGAVAKSARRAAVPAVTVLPSEKVGTISAPVRETLRRLPSRHWKQSLEKNLIEEGIAPAKAKKLVELAAS